MPEGDTIHHAARRIRPLVEGLVPEIAHPSPRLRTRRGEVVQFDGCRR